MKKYVLASSWEVCNKVGGIYTVLSTKACALQQQFVGQVIFVGPDLGKTAPEFTEDPTLFPDWVSGLGRRS